MLVQIPLTILGLARAGAPCISEFQKSSDLPRSNPLWLAGAYAPTAQKLISKCQKIPENNSGVHPDILCAHTKFREKKDIFCGICKKAKNCFVKSFWSTNFFSFIHKPQFFVSRNLISAHRMSGCTPRKKNPEWEHLLL